eukprot:scaffold98340_cov48-Phaeocystis_antarctica.AAC.2
MSAAAGPVGTCSDPPPAKRSRNARRRACAARLKVGQVEVDGPPGQLRHGPHCGPAQLNGWANRSIWSKVRVRCQEAVFSTGAWLDRVMAAESGHGWPASRRAMAGLPADTIGASGPENLTNVRRAQLVAAARRSSRDQLGV